MDRHPISGTPPRPFGRGSWLGLLLLAAGCEQLTEPAALSPPEANLPSAAQPLTLTHVGLEVDPASGSVALRDSPARDGEGGAAHALIAVNNDLVRSSATCEGCRDENLSNQTITVRFTVGEVVLTGVDFRRTEAGEAIPTMTCSDCRVRDVLLRGVVPSPLPAELNAGDVFEAVLRIDALEPRPFTVRFDLVATAIRPLIQLEEETITAGVYHSCGLTAEGRAYCWGGNGLGELGDGTQTNRLVPTPVAGNHTFISLSAGGRHTVGLTPDGHALAWGMNSKGQLGDGTTTDRLVPTPVASNHTLVSLSAGGSHTVALTSSGQALAWGDNLFAQLGDGTRTDRWLPTPVAGNHAFGSLSGGSNHTVGIVSTGQALAWGSNVYGQLGDGTRTLRLVPTLVAGNHTFRSLSAGGHHTVGLTPSGRALAWGMSDWGQLGTPFDGSSGIVPTPVAGNYIFRSLSAGLDHTVGLTSSGRAFAWGENDWGRLGDGTTRDRRTPTRVTGDHTFVSLSAGGMHTVGVTTAGQVLAWGWNDRGQLGNGGHYHSSRGHLPRPVAGNLTFR